MHKTIVAFSVSDPHKLRQYIIEQGIIEEDQEVSTVELDDLPKILEYQPEYRGEHLIIEEDILLKIASCFNKITRICHNRTNRIAAITIEISGRFYHSD